jgi:hypothetical protein
VFIKFWVQLDQNYYYFKVAEIFGISVSKKPNEIEFNILTFGNSPASSERKFGSPPTSPAKSKSNDSQNKCNAVTVMEYTTSEFPKSMESISEVIITISKIFDLINLILEIESLIIQSNNTQGGDTLIKLMQALTNEKEILFLQQGFTEFKNLITKLLQMEKQILFLHIYYNFSCSVCKILNEEMNSFVENFYAILYSDSWEVVQIFELDEIMKKIFDCPLLSLSFPHLKLLFDRVPNEFEKVRNDMIKYNERVKHAPKSCFRFWGP